MNWILADCTLDQLRSILGIVGVNHVSRGVRELPDGRFRTGAYVEESAVPLMQASGVTVTVVQTQADIDTRLQQVQQEQLPDA